MQIIFCLLFYAFHHSWIIYYLTGQTTCNNRYFHAIFILILIFFSFTWHIFLSVLFRQIVSSIHTKHLSRFIPWRFTVTFCSLFYLFLPIFFRFYDKENLLLENDNLQRKNKEIKRVSKQVSATSGEMVEIYYWMNPLVLIETRE